jgi:hypothetical protein
MAKARNYTKPTMVVRQFFTDDTTRQSVPAMIHISGPHANFVSASDATAELGYLGTYSARDGLFVELPRCLAGKVLDRDSVTVTFKNAWLRYFKTTTETFLIPKGARNVVACSPSLQSAGFSFRQNGPVDRAAAFYDRDVQIGDAVRVTANIGGEAKELWTTIAAVVPRYSPGVVLPNVLAGSRNVLTGPSLLVVAGQSEAAGSVTVTLGKDAGWYEPILQRGLARDTYFVECLIGGNATAARFRIISMQGDNLGSVRAEEVEQGGATENRLMLSSLGAWLVLPDTEMFTPEMNWTVQADAAVTVQHPVSSGVYQGPSSERLAREVTYIITVSKGGMIPATEPATETGRYACPTLSVTTTDGSDKMPLVRVLEQGKPVLISRFGVEITFDTDYLMEGDKFFVTCRSAYSDIYPTLILNRNVPDDWVNEDDDSRVALELFLVEKELDVPEFAMTAMGRRENWTVESGGIRFRTGLTLYSPVWKIGGILSDLPVHGREADRSSQVYLSMRYFLPDLANQVVLIRSIADLNEMVSGPVTPDNPLKYAAYHALNNGFGSQVLLTGVVDPTDLAEWRKVTDLISERDDVFSVMPLSMGDQAVNDLFYEHILEMNQDETAKERMLYLIAHDRELIPILTTDRRQPAVGTLSVETSVGSSRYAAYTATSDGIDFPAAGVKPGDTLRTHFDYDYSGRDVWSEYTIDEVVNAVTLRLRSDPGGIAGDQVPMAFEIWRSQSHDDYADSIAETAGYDDKLVIYIYANNADPDYNPIGPAATLLGLIGAVVPHQGVTWYPLEGISADNWTNRFSNKQLNHIAGNGVLVISKHTDGYVCARHAVTTSKSPLSANPRTALTMKMTEEMFVRNALLVKKEFRNAIKGFNGITNITQGTKVAILANINMKADQLKRDVDYPRLGGRILSGPDDLDIREHALFTDHLIVSGRVTGPVPLKVLEFNLFI